MVIQGGPLSDVSRVLIPLVAVINYKHHQLPIYVRPFNKTGAHNSLHFFSDPRSTSLTAGSNNLGCSWTSSGISWILPWTPPRKHSSPSGNLTFFLKAGESHYIKLVKTYYPKLFQRFSIAEILLMLQKSGEKTTWNGAKTRKKTGISTTSNGDCRISPSTG